MPRSTTPTRSQPLAVQVVLFIGGTAYRVIPLRTDPAVARKAYRLTKLADAPALYDVRLGPHGPECDCPGFVRWQRCKHVRALGEAGMIDAA